MQTAIEGIQAQLETLADDDPRRSSLVTQLANFETTLDQLRVDAALRTGGAVDHPVGRASRRRRSNRRPHVLPCSPRSSVCSSGSAPRS